MLGYNDCHTHSTPHQSSYYIQLEVLKNMNMNDSQIAVQFLSRCSRFSVPPFSILGGYVETSFSLPGGTLKRFNVLPPPPGTLKLEKAQFEITSPSFRLPPGVR